MQFLHYCQKVLPREPTYPSVSGSWVWKQDQVWKSGKKLYLFIGVAVFNLSVNLKLICFGFGDWAKSASLAARLSCFYRYQFLFSSPTALCGLDLGRFFDLSSHYNNYTNPVWVNTTICLLLFLVLCNIHYNQRDLLGNISYHKSCPTEDSHHCPQWCQFLSHQNNGQRVSPRKFQRT